MHFISSQISLSLSPMALLLFLFITTLTSTNFIHISSSHPTCNAPNPPHALPIYEQDVDLLQFAENIEFLEAEFFTWGALGYGLDHAAPQLVMGGPPPVGARKANLDLLTQNIIKEFGYQEVGHLRLIIAWPSFN